MSALRESAGTLVEKLKGLFSFKGSLCLLEASILAASASSGRRGYEGGCEKPSVLTQDYSS